MEKNEKIVAIIISLNRDEILKPGRCTFQFVMLNYFKPDNYFFAGKRNNRDKI